MSVSISGSNAISGLGGNDTDFDKVLSQLKQIESTQLRRLESWKSDWNLRYEAFTQIIDQVKAASSMLSQLADKNTFVTKTVQSSNSNVVTAVANAAAQDVQHTIKVSQIANNAIWANTGHVFDSKTDIINTSGAAQNFSYTYAGKRYDFSVPPNTTLDSFASMVNNSADNPGIKVSIVQTGKGYVFQVSGKSTGAANDLIIHDSNLVGMNSAGSSSIWQTNDPLNFSQNVTNPTNFIFDLELQDGKKVSVTVKGTATPDDLAVALSNAAGGIKASVDASGNLTLEGVKSFSRRGEEPYKPASTRFSLAGDIKDAAGNEIRLNDPSDPGALAVGMADNEVLILNIVMDDDSQRQVNILAGATKKEFFTAVAQATQAPGIPNRTPKDNAWGINLAGVANITVDNATLNTAYRVDVTEAVGSRGDLGADLTSVSTTLTFAGALDKPLDGNATDGGSAVVFTLVKDDGIFINIKAESGETIQDLLAKLADNGVTVTDTTDASGKPTYKMDGVREFYLSQGDISSPAYEVSHTATVVVPATNPTASSPADNLFFNDRYGSLTLEKPPVLEYTFTTNDGKKGVLTLPSGTSMTNLLKALQNPTDPGWNWTDSDGTSPAAVPATWKVRLTDAEGKEYLDAAGNPLDPSVIKEYLDAAGNPLDPSVIDGPVYLTLQDVQQTTGPVISGQVAQSSNWSIQRATNARYQIDNWPIEMESETNTVGDAIEGVVFSLQEVGEGRITVSTDITSVEQSIQNFLDAVNSVLITVNDLMKYDETKEVTSNDPNDIGNGNYSASGLTNQKGSLLTGNYGVQLFKSRFSTLLSTSPPGFQSRASAEDVLSGDLLASLSNLGIKTDTDTTSDTYGLLVLAPSSSIAALQSMDKDNYNDMITNHLEAVVDFFCASGIGSSSSTDFRYGSHVEGITKGGVYDVTYTVLQDGSITNVMVGGEPAIQDTSQPGNYFSVATGDPRGLAIMIDDLTVGAHPPAGEAPMTVRIKEGLVQTVNSWLKSELVFNDVNLSTASTPQQNADALALKSQNGALMSLRDNYKKVMESIDVKIEREQRRISMWESRQKAIFANLETLLKQYSQQQTSLEAQLNQLKGNS